MKNKLILFTIFILILAVQFQGLCATKYLRNVGTTNWNVDASWGTNADGTGDTTFPTSADDVVINAVASTTVLTVNVSSACKSLDMTDFIGTFAGSGTNYLYCYGNLIFGAGQTVTYSSSIIFRGTGNITSNGKTLPCSVQLTEDYSQSVTLNDDLHITGMNIYYGIFDANNKNIIIDGLAYNAYSPTINMGSGAWTVGSWIMVHASITVNCQTSTLNCSGNFEDSGGVYNIVNLTGSSSIITITGANTYANLTITGHASSTGGYAINANQTVTGTFTANGNSSVNKMVLKSSDTTVRTITAPTVNLSNIDYYQNIKGAGDGWIGKVPFFNSSNSWNPTMKYSGILR